MVRCKHECFLTCLCWQQNIFGNYCNTSAIEKDLVCQCRYSNGETNFFHSQEQEGISTRWMVVYVNTYIDPNYNLWENCSMQSMHTIQVCKDKKERLIYNSEAHLYFYRFLLRQDCSWSTIVTNQVIIENSAVLLHWSNARWTCGRV